MAAAILEYLQYSGTLNFEYDAVFHKSYCTSGA